MESSIQVLRRILDERGVEYTANERDTQWWPKDNPAGVLAETSRYPRGTLDVYGLTPEQAIAATLGSSSCTNDCTNSERTNGTCQVDTTENWLPAERYHRCKRCGAFFAVLDASSDIPPRYCPNCGRKVVDA